MLIKMDFFFFPCAKLTCIMLKIPSVGVKENKKNYSATFRYLF